MDRLWLAGAILIGVGAVLWTVLIVLGREPLLSGTGEVLLRLAVAATFYGCYRLIVWRRRLDEATIAS
jgi:hypothetical protein